MAEMVVPKITGAATVGKRKAEEPVKELEAQFLEALAKVKVSRLPTPPDQKTD